MFWLFCVPKWRIFCVPKWLKILCSKVTQNLCCKVTLRPSRGTTEGYHCIFAGSLCSQVVASGHLSSLLFVIVPPVNRSWVSTTANPTEQCVWTMASKVLKVQLVDRQQLKLARQRARLSQQDWGCRCDCKDCVEEAEVLGRALGRRWQGRPHDPSLVYLRDFPCTKKGQSRWSTMGATSSNGFFYKYIYIYITSKDATRGSWPYY